MGASSVRPRSDSRQSVDSFAGLTLCKDYDEQNARLRRIHESGAEIATQLIRSRVLGLRPSRSFLTIDPVLPRSLDGLRAVIELAGVPVDIVYAIGDRGYGPTALTCYGAPLVTLR